MTLNPITALSEQLQKLINEHGSSTILKERLGLIQDKAAEFERKFNLLTAENLALRNENAKQKADNTRLTTENTDLKERLKGYEQPIHDNLLDDIEIKILLYVANNACKNSTQIAEATGIAETIIDFNLQEMKEKNLVTAHVGSWFIEQKGRKYLIENKLIS